MIISNVFRIDKNVGDANCAPLKYFDIPGREKFFHDLGEIAGPPLGADIIVGGGGVLYYRRTVLNLLSVRPKQKVIFWGGGTNTHFASSTLNYPEEMNQFDLVGTRDWNAGFEWVPCPSCMSPLFDNARRDKSVEVAVFEHWKHSLPVALDAPRMRNWDVSLAKVVEFMAPVDILLTNSYHGVYWGNILGCRVIAFPFSSKFHFMKHPPSFCIDKSRWAKHSHVARKYPVDILEEYRDANRAFHRKVVELLT